MHPITNARQRGRWWVQRIERVPAVERAALIGVLGAIALMGSGTAWDIHWHATVGRDSPWIPPHLAVYLGTALAAALGSAMLLGTRSPARGFWSDPYALVWTGGSVMVAAAVVDAIWHELIGDRTLWSPPHVLGVVGAIILTFGSVLGWRQARTRGVFPPRVCQSAEILLLAGYMVAAYYSLRAPVILAFRPDFPMPPFVVTTSPYVTAALASVMVPAVVLYGRVALSRWWVDVGAVLAVVIWVVQEMLHRVLTPWVAAQAGTAMVLSRAPEARFGLLTLGFMLLPALAVNHTPLRRPGHLGVAMAGLYTAIVALWLAVIGAPASVSPAAVAVIVALGGLSGWAGAACARWISHVSEVDLP